MTERVYALTVLLEKDIREDDAEAIVNAIKMIKHVLKVEKEISDSRFWAAQVRAKQEIYQKLWQVVE